jgi:hypothetical protein
LSGTHYILRFSSATGLVNKKVLVKEGFLILGSVNLIGEADVLCTSNN